MCEIWLLLPTSEIIYCVCDMFNSSTPCIYKNQHSMLKGLMPSYFPLTNCVSIAKSLPEASPCLMFSNKYITECVSVYSTPVDVCSPQLRLSAYTVQEIIMWFPAEFVSYVHLQRIKHALIFMVVNFRKRDSQLKILLPKKTHYIKVDLHVTDND